MTWTTESWRVSAEARLAEQRKNRVKHKKTYVSGSGPEPDSNPFSKLAGKFPDAPEEDSTLVSDKPGPAKPIPPFRVARTRKGGYPISVERRAAGKTVTIVRNVSGDVDALLTMLKKRCAAGGKAFEDSLEVQGDHCDKVEAFLREQGL